MIPKENNFYDTVGNFGYRQLLEIIKKMNLKQEQKEMLARKIVQHMVDMASEDDLCMGAISGGMFKDAPEAETAYVNGVAISVEKHSNAIGVASRLLGFDSKSTWDVVRQCFSDGSNPVEVILARSK